MDSGTWLPDRPLPSASAPDPDFVPAPAFVEAMDPEERDKLLAELSPKAAAKYQELLERRNQS